MRIFQWRYVGRFSAAGGNLATTTGSEPTLIAPANRNRVALLIANRGAGTAFFNDDKATLQQLGANAGGGWRLKTDEANAPGTAPVAPHNPIYAMGEATADLDVAEIIETDDNV